MSNSQQAITLKCDNLAYWCIYVSLGYNELTITYAPHRGCEKITVYIHLMLHVKKLCQQFSFHNQKHAIDHCVSYMAEWSQTC